MKILGFDPAFRTTGFGIVELTRFSPSYVASGSIRLEKFEGAMRLVKLQESVLRLLTQFSPDAVALETPFVYKNPQSAIKLGMARGVIMAAVASQGLPIAEYAPTQIKSATVGKGHATKQQMQFMVTQLLGLSEYPSEDASDALACALTHAKLSAFAEKRVR